MKVSLATYVNVEDFLGIPYQTIQVHWENNLRVKEKPTSFLISLSLSLSLSLLLSLSPTLPHPAVACGKGGPQIVTVFFQLLPFSLQFCLSCRRGQKVTNNVLLEVLAHLPKGRYMYIHTYNKDAYRYNLHIHNIQCTCTCKYMLGKLYHCSY